jgi:integrase
MVPIIQVERGVKNDFRKRPLPLHGDSHQAILWLLDRARGLGAGKPEHYLFPHRAAHRGALPDPARPMYKLGWKRAHYAICKEAAKKFPRLERLRMYDWRHLAATDMMEDPTISWTTIEHMLGHRINSKTKRKYDHIRNAALRAAAKTLDRGHLGEAPKRAPEPVREQHDLRRAAGMG